MGKERETKLYSAKKKNKDIFCIDPSSDAVIQYNGKIVHTKMLSSLQGVLTS